MGMTNALSDGVLRLTIAGAVPQAEWLAGLSVGLSAAAGGPPRGLIFDCRDATDSRTADQLREIVDVLTKHRSVLNGRCVVLVATTVCFGAARMFGVFMEPHGFDVLVTADEAEPDRWVRGVTPAGPTAAWPTATAG